MMIDRHPFTTPKLIARFGILMSLAILGTHCSSGPQTATIAGSVMLDGETNHEGIDVYIPGTGYFALTDARGRFRIDGIAPAALEVVAGAPGFEEFRQTIDLKSNEIHVMDPIVLHSLKPVGGTLHGRIAIDGEDRYDGIVVLLVGASLSTSTDENGEYRFDNLSPGLYELAAFKQGYGSVQEQDIEIKSGETTEAPELILDNPSVQSAMIDEAAEPIQGVTGSYIIRGLALLENRQEHSGTLVAVADIPEYATHTTPDGGFYLEGLPEGTYDLEFSHEGFQSTRIANVQSVTLTEFGFAPFVTVSLNEITEPLGLGAVRGKITLEGAASQDGISIRLIGVQQNTTTGLDGSFAFVGIPSGQYILIAEREGYRPGRTFVTVPANGVAAGIELELKRGTGELPQEGQGTIHGRVLLDRSTIHAGVLVSVQGTSAIGITDIEGFYSIPGVPAGLHQLLFEKAEYQQQILDADLLSNSELELQTVVMVQKMNRPYITETLPRDGDRKIPIGDAGVDVLVTFSEPMSGRDVKSAVSITPKVSYQLFFDRESQLSNINRLHILLLQQPGAPIHFEEEYRVTIGESAASMSGVTMKEPYSFQFKTDGPLVLRTNPENDSEVMLFPGEYVWFETNALIDPRTVNRAIRFRPQPDSNPDIFLERTRSGNRVNISITVKENTRYQMTIGRELRTVNGERFSNVPFVTRFKTSEIVGNSPNDPVSAGRASRSPRLNRSRQ